MSGHYILTSIDRFDVIKAQGQPLGATLSGRQHANVGWNVGSRATLSTALAGGNIGNRNTLPPHIYLMINANNPLPALVQSYLKIANWVDKLQRPNAVGLGLAMLCPAANAHWPNNKAQSLIEQIQHGAVSIEIYYQDGIEV